MYNMNEGATSREQPKREPVQREAKGTPLFDCPLKDDHKIPYGSAAYCGKFKGKEISVEERRDMVKKLNLCSKCLKSLIFVKHAECQIAPDVEKTSLQRKTWK